VISGTPQHSFVEYDGEAPTMSKINKILMATAAAAAVYVPLQSANAFELHGSR